LILELYFSNLKWNGKNVGRMRRTQPNLRRFNVDPPVHLMRGIAMNAKRGIAGVAFFYWCFWREKKQKRGLDGTDIATNPFTSSSASNGKKK